LDCDFSGAASAGFSGIGTCDIRFGSDDDTGVATSPVDQGLVASDKHWAGWGLVRRDTPAFAFPQGYPGTQAGIAGGYWIEENWGNCSFYGSMRVAGLRLLGGGSVSAVIGQFSSVGRGRIVLGAADSSYMKVNATGSAECIQTGYKHRMVGIKCDFQADSGHALVTWYGGEHLLVVLPGFVTGESASGDTVRCEGAHARTLLQGNPDTSPLGRAGGGDYNVVGNVGSPFDRSDFASVGDKEVGDEFNIVKNF
jgi:hypothetical protein